MNRYYDQIYYALSLGILVALAYSTYAGLKLRRLEPVKILQRRALGISLAAIGIALTSLAGLLADFFLKSSQYFQQVRFGFFFAGFALLTFGLEAIARATQETCDLPVYLSQSKYTRFLLWFLFLGTLVISAFYLVNPNTFILNKNGIQIQRIIYWLPMLTITLVGAIFLLLLAYKVHESGERAHLLWIGAFLALIFVGLLRESLILPDLGDPLSNLLIAYVPFTLGSICLCFGVRSLLKNAARKSQNLIPL